MVRLARDQEALVQVDVSLADDEVWFFCYDHWMSEPRWSTHLRADPAQFRHRARYACQCEDAYLAWNLRGVPYIEPCLPNLLIRRVNDASVRSRHEPDKFDAKALWHACSPGIVYDGHLPPPAEGMVWKLKTWEWEAMAESFEGYTPAELPGPLRMFVNGDLAQAVGVLPGAVTLIAKNECCVDPARGDVFPLPSFMTQMRMRRATIISNLSQPYQGHLYLMLNYSLATEASPVAGSAFDVWRRRVGLRLFQILHYLPYLFIVFPLIGLKPRLTRLLGVSTGAEPTAPPAGGRLKPRAKGWDVRLVEATVRFVWRAGIGLERHVFRPVFGSGWTV